MPIPKPQYAGAQRNCIKYSSREGPHCMPVVCDASHNSHLDNPQFINDAIREFVAERW